MLFAYFGPETVLPLTSMAAAAVGFLMMFGQQALRLTRLAFRRVFRGRRAPAARWTIDGNLRRDGSEPAGVMHPMAQNERVRS